ncbi:MAG: hypothetical protein ACJ790_00650 [Myxococcaceae bacterium]
MSLTLLLVVLMVCMTLSISTRIRHKMELQTTADTAAYSNAVMSARALNSMAIINRTIVSHWVAMLGVQANHAWATTTASYFDGLADFFNDERDRNACSTKAKEDLRQAELLEARNAFLHASLNLWSGGNAASDNVSLRNCTNSTCIKRLTPGFAQMDKAVIDQTKDVWQSIRDLVEVQNDIQKNLLDALKQQTLVTNIALLSQGKAPGGNPYPYTIERGAPLLDNLGIPDRIPAEREVSGALGTTGKDLMPLAHAVMGSRGNHFVMSGKVEYGNNAYPVAPPRARLWTSKIQKLLNSEFGGGTFKFRLKSELSASYLDSGDPQELGWGTNDLGSDPDNDWNNAEQGTEETNGDLGDQGPPPPQQPFYDVDRVSRVTPARSVGWIYATGRYNGHANVLYESPCGGHFRTIPVMAAARAHTRMGLDLDSAHTWMFAKDIKKTGQTADGSREVYYSGVNAHGHEEQRNPNPMKEGFEVPRHQPETMCHGGHRHWGEVADERHWLGNQVNNMGVAPGGFGFVFPQNGTDPDTGADLSGAVGAFGQPKLPVLLTLQQSGSGAPKDPWDLTLNFSFKPGGGGTELDLAKRSATDPMAVLATGISYYHRRCNQHQNPKGPANGNRSDCRSWKESPNMLNPYWRATLVPIDIDEHSAGSGIDKTPGTRRINEAKKMLKAAKLPDAADTYVALKSRGYQGIQ